MPRTIWPNRRRIVVPAGVSQQPALSAVRVLALGAQACGVVLDVRRDDVGVVELLGETARPRRLRPRRTPGWPHGCRAPAAACRQGQCRLRVAHQHRQSRGQAAEQGIVRRFRRQINHNRAELPAVRVIADLAAQRVGQQLVPVANAEGWDAALAEPARAATPRPVRSTAGVR